MICGFCHREIPAEVGAIEGRKACGQCFGGCKKIHCPYCGFTNPAPGRLMAKLLRRQEKGRNDA